MARRKGWLRMGLVLLVLWWGYCFLQYDRLGRAAAAAEEEYWMQPIDDVGEFVANVDRGFAAKREQRNVLIGAFAIPALAAAALGVGIWIAHGFRSENGQKK